MSFGTHCVDDGGIAQLGEHLPCKQGVSGSIPLTSTKTVDYCYNGLEYSTFVSKINMGT